MLPKVRFQVLFFLLIIVGLPALIILYAQGSLSAERQPITTTNATKVEVLATFEGLPGGVASIALSPDGNMLVYGSYADNHVHIVDVATLTEVKVLEGHTAPVSALAFSPDGALLVSTGTVNLPPAEDGFVRLWDFVTGEELAVIQTEGTNMLAFSPDGSTFAGASGGNPIHLTIWEAETGEELLTIDNLFGVFSFSPDGAFLASRTRDDMVHIWDMDAQAEAMTLAGHDGWVEAVAFSADGTLLASGGEDFTVRMWDTESGEQVKLLEGHSSGIAHLAFSPDGSLLASVGSGIVITRDGAQIQFSLSGADQVVRLWNVATGQELTLLDDTSSWATDAGWTLFASASSEGVIKLWGIAD